jgi:hypothetical protein
MSANYNIRTSKFQYTGKKEIKRKGYLTVIRNKVPDQFSIFTSKRDTCTKNQTTGGELL